MKKTKLILIGTIASAAIPFVSVVSASCEKTTEKQKGAENATTNQNNTSKPADTSSTPVDSAKSQAVNLLNEKIDALPMDEYLVKDKENTLPSDVTLEKLTQQTPSEDGVERIVQIKDQNNQKGTLVISFKLRDKNGNESGEKDIFVTNLLKAALYSVEQLNEMVARMDSDTIYLPKKYESLPSEYDFTEASISYKLGQLKAESGKLFVEVKLVESNDSAGNAKITVKLIDKTNGKTKSTEAKELTISGFKASNPAQDYVETVNLEIPNISEKTIDSIQNADIQVVGGIKEGYELIITQTQIKGSELSIYFKIKEKASNLESSSKLVKLSGFKASEGKQYLNSLVHRLSEEKTLFVIDESKKTELKQAFDVNIKSNKSYVKIENGIFKNDKKWGKTIEGISVNSQITSLNTHGRGAQLGWTAPKSGSNKGIYVTKNGDVYTLHWYCVLSDGSFDTEKEYTLEIN
ncbi:lipoprotein 17-related variable surface protein [Mycoplasmopsis felifaucium]|uniref:Lipoprotein 17-related variable surface protein n=1 Tax=Mycoplasmopsis felifaucium TaxID=35768 RepID=A0ABZ2RPT8_9BACT